jgi:DNA ligase (NAD+)
LHAARAFDIQGLGSKTIDKFIQLGLLSSPVDIFKLRVDQISQLDGFGEVSAKKIVDEITSKKTIGLSSFITALSIEHVGETTSDTLARYFGSLDKILNASLNELKDAQDVGDVVAGSVYNYCKNDEHKKLIEGYLSLGVSIKKQNSSKKTLSGLTFVITGSLSSITRDDAKNKVRDLGGKIASSVSKKTSFVVVGDDPGSKYEKAKEFGIKILSESEFLSKLSQ